mmetsp:Transcript_28257/g.63758  ORF Transcript_28257/g.63758 Transcript_28257/m.63758 type:complete len:89 (+) Transcript_28257:137-403(+)
MSEKWLSRGRTAYPEPKKPRKATGTPWRVWLTCWWLSDVSCHYSSAGSRATGRALLQAIHLLHTLQSAQLCTEPWVRMQTLAVQAFKA